jgi:hypothetical protein
MSIAVGASTKEPAPSWDIQDPWRISDLVEGECDSRLSYSKSIYIYIENIESESNGKVKTRTQAHSPHDFNAFSRAFVWLSQQPALSKQRVKGKKEDYAQVKCQGVT